MSRDCTLTGTCIHCVMLILYCVYTQYLNKRNHHAILNSLQIPQIGGHMLKTFVTTAAFSFGMYTKDSNTLQFLLLTLVKHRDKMLCY